MSHEPVRQRYRRSWPKGQGWSCLKRQVRACPGFLEPEAEAPDWRSRSEQWTTP